MASSTIIYNAPNLESATNIASINEFIKHKEKELHEIHNLRINHLEALVKERDDLLLDAAKRFEQLREDFQYNITLIEARDKEIQRLDKICQEKSFHSEKLHDENVTLSTNMDAMRSAQHEKDLKREEDKIANKKILDELKDVIESMRWASAEEVRSRNWEIDRLRSEIHSSNVQREESLESQRKDLTEAFENIIHMRENSFAEKERHIAEQINLLERRFEQLQTENSRLKTDLIDAHGECENLSTSMTRQEESRSQLQWLFEDERSQKLANEDTMKRQIQKLSVDLSVSKESAAKKTFDLENEIEKISLELTREKEFRGMLEHRLEEVRTVSQQDLSSLEREVGDERRHLSILQSEVDAVKEEKESALNRAASTRLELDAMEASYRLIAKERDSIRAEAQSLSATLKENIEQQQKLQADFNQQILESNSRVKDLLQQISSLQNDREHLMQHHEEEKLRLSAEHEAALKISQSHLTSADELRRELLSQASETGHASSHLQQQVNERDATIRDLEAQLKVAKEALQNEKTEAAALQLRLQLHENSQQQQQRHRPQQIPLPSRNRISIPQNERVQHQRLAVPVGNSDDYNEMDEEEYQRRVDMTPIIAPAGLQMMSPAFSEDLGPASFSSSMLLMPLSPSQSPRRVDRGSPTGFDNPRPKRMSSLNQQISTSDDSDDHRLTELMNENERLKNFVREMRRDIEVLKNTSRNKAEQEKVTTGIATNAPPPLPPPPPASAGSTATVAVSTVSAAVNTDSYDILERRLKQTVEEVSRLKNERKKIMDVSNELRAALNKKDSSEMQFSQSSSALPSYMDPQLRMAMPPPPPPAAAVGLGSTTQSTYSTTGENIWDSKPYQYNMPWTERGDTGSRILDGKIATVPGPLMDDFLQNTADRAFNDLSLQGRSVAKHFDHGQTSRRPPVTTAARMMTIAKKLPDEKEKLQDREAGKVPVRATRQVRNYAKKQDS